MNTNCYAFKSVDECKILSNNNNCGRYCSFRKTEEERLEKMTKTYDLLSVLPHEMQLYISGKYYQGKLPWLKNQTNQNKF